MTACFPIRKPGRPINVSHMIPRSKEDIQRRHRGLRRIAEHTVGVMGRTPDYMNVTYAGFAGCAHEWAEHGNEAGAARLVEYQKFLRRHDISLTHTLIHPTTDKAKDENPRPDNDIILHKVATPSTASWCAALASCPRWRRSPTSWRCIRGVRCRKTATNSRCRSAFRWRRPG